MPEYRYIIKDKKWAAEAYSLMAVNERKALEKYLLMP